MFHVVSRSRCLLQDLYRNCKMYSSYHRTGEQTGAVMKYWEEDTKTHSMIILKEVPRNTQQQHRSLNFINDSRFAFTQFLRTPRDIRCTHTVISRIRLHSTMYLCTRSFLSCSSTISSTATAAVTVACLLLYYEKNDRKGFRMPY